MLGRVGHGVRGKAHAGTIDGSVAEQVAVMMQALATPSRVLILARLRESPHAVGERRGRQIVCAVHDSHVADLLDDAAYHLEHLRLGHRERVARAS